MNKKLLAIMVYGATALALLSIGDRADAAMSLRISTITASVTLTYDAIAPEIAHTPLKTISLVKKLAVIEGAVTDNYDIRSVDIFYRNSNDQSWSTSTVTTSSVQLKELPFSLTVPQEFIRSTLEYKIKARDRQNLTEFPGEGAWQQVPLGDVARKAIGLGGGIIELDGNGGTSLDIPKGALNGTVNITISEVECGDPGVGKGAPPAVSRRPLALYRFEPSHLVFNKLATMKLLYADLDNDGKVDGTPYNEETLKVMWWDGFAWRMLETTVDKDNNIAASSIIHFSYYAIFPAGIITDDDYRPKERIITPVSKDTFNDYANFPMVGQNDIVNIYDVNGKRVRQLKGEKLWDGKDDNGTFVESGMYIYQIKTPDRLISGVITIAK